MAFLLRRNVESYFHLFRDLRNRYASEEYQNLSALPKNPGWAGTCFLKLKRQITGIFILKASCNFLCCQSLFRVESFREKAHQMV